MIPGADAFERSVRSSSGVGDIELGALSVAPASSGSEGVRVGSCRSARFGSGSVAMLGRAVTPRELDKVLLAVADRTS